MTTMFPPFVSFIFVLTVYIVSYYITGLFVLAVNIIVFIVMALSGVSVAAIADNITEVVTIAVIIQYVISILLYLLGVPIDNYNINPDVNNGKTYL